MRHIEVAAVAVLLTVAVGCGDDAEPAPAPLTMVTADAGSDAGREAAAMPPALLVAERVQQPDGRKIYVSLLPDLPTAPVDRKKAYEFPSVSVWVHDGSVFVSNSEDKTMTRYEVTPDLELVQGQKFSFQAVGLKAGGFMAFLSKTRAYLFDSTDWRVIVWNPSAMEITGTFPIGVERKPGFPNFQFLPPTIRGDKVFIPIWAWEDRMNLKVHPAAWVLAFDTMADGPPTLIEDPRITGSRSVYADSRGDLYVIGEHLAGLYNVVGEAAGKLPPAGVLRIKSGSLTFDPDYFIDLSAITKSPAIFATYRVDENHLLAQLWDPAVNPATKVVAAGDYFGAAEFIYTLVDLRGATSTPLTSIPKAGAGSTSEFRLDGKLYVQFYQARPDGIRDAVVHVVNSTGTQEAFSIPSGDLWALERVR
jgi:hypothetical protein